MTGNLRGTLPGWFALYLFCVIWPVVRANTAAANPLQDENALPGTTSWQLANPAANREIEGYASLTSVNQGGQISLFVNTADANYTIEVFRMGWYGGTGARKLWGPIQLAGTRQVTPAANATTGLIECNWTNPYVLNIPSSWISGVYLAKLTAVTSGKQNYIIFVVREDGRAALYLFQSCVTTYQAYNNWPGQNIGGKSLYDFNSAGSKAAVKVSFNRPYATGSGADDFLNPGWEYNMVRFLEREGYDVTYCTNIDVHENADILLSHKGFLSVGHDEYWSWDMRANVTAARDKGISLAFLSADVCYWQIRLEPSAIDGGVDRTQVGYKLYFAQDPYYLDNDPRNDKYITNLWRSNPVALPEEDLVGVEYIEDPVNSDIVIADPAHWALAGTGAVAGQKLVGLLGYEVDGLVQPGVRSGLSIIAHSPIPQLDPAATAYPYSDMTSYTAPSGATVFAAGSIQWAWGLDDFNVPAVRTSRLSAVAQQITRNVLSRLGASPVPPLTLAPSQILSFIVDDSLIGTGANQWDFGSGWFSCPSPIAYQGDEHYAFATGAIAHFRFNGTQTKIYTVQEPADGNIGFSLDGGAEQIVSNYLPLATGNSLSYTSPIVAAGNHDLAIRVTGSHQAGASSNTITVDKAEVYATSNPPSQQTLSATVNDSVVGTGNNQWDYGPGWFRALPSSAYLGDEHYAFTSGALAHFRFDGAQVKIYSVKEPVGGNIGYTLDGGSEQVVSNYSPVMMSGNSLSYASPVVAPGSHDLAIRVVGTHEASSTSNTITVDKAEVYTAPVSSTVVDDSVTGAGTNEWDFGPGWFGCPQPAAYRGDEHYAFTSGATAHFRFNGTQVKIYTVKEPVDGNIGYTLDGGSEQVVSNYSPVMSGNSLSYASPVVAPGNHDLAIRVVGTHEANSTSNTVTVDKAEVF